MGRNPLDLHRKIVRYNSQIKIMRRGCQIKCNDSNNDKSNIYNLDIKPNFAIGTFQIKGNVGYHLVINVDLPRKSEGLIVDFYGMSSSSNLELLNRHLITSSNRDIRINFWTYPKTRYIFLTFSILTTANEIDDASISNFTNKSSSSSIVYSINYIFIDSKDPLPRNIASPAIPNNLKLTYDLECNPRTLEELELNDPLKIFENKLPINLDIFEHSLLTYLLQKETSPNFIESLKNNISNCNIPSNHSNTMFKRINLVDLTSLRDVIIKKSREMEEYLSKIDNLQQHKNSIENSLEREDFSSRTIDRGDNSPHSEHDNTSLNDEKYENYVNILQKFQDALNAKLNTLRQLKSINRNQNGKLEKTDIDNISEIIDYYENRVIKDKLIITEHLNSGTSEWNTYKKEIINPLDKQLNNQQNKLDKILSHYRSYQNKTIVLKKEIDSLIIKFMIQWYQYILSKNIPNKSY